MPDPVCRLAVQHGLQTVDLALPSDAPVGALLPSIADLVGRGTAAADEGRQWYLSRIGQGRIDEMTSLRDNGVRDGELLLLTTAAIPAPTRISDDPWRAVIDAADNGCVPTRVTATAACAVAALLGASALVWSGIVTHATRHVVTAALIAAATAIGAVAVQRAHHDATVCVTLSVTAVVFAAIAGFLAVPGDPSAASSLLGTAVACSTSFVLLRIARCGAICLTALATLSALASVASACAVAWMLPITTMGAVLAPLSLATLGVAARLSITAAGLAPAMSSSGDPAQEDLSQPTPRAITAHHTLSGLVFGSACAAALGSVLLASKASGAALAAVVGLVMVLRARTHIDALRRTVLVAGGAAAVVASCAAVVVSAPAQANWICLLSIAVGVSMLGDGFGTTANPLVRRAVEVLEYLALAAVVPLACWVGGVYDLVRGLSLP